MLWGGPSSNTVGSWPASWMDSCNTTPLSSAPAQAIRGSVAITALPSWLVITWPRGVPARMPISSSVAMSWAGVTWSQPSKRKNHTYRELSSSAANTAIQPKANTLRNHNRDRAMGRPCFSRIWIRQPRFRFSLRRA